MILSRATSYPPVWPRHPPLDAVLLTPQLPDFKRTTDGPGARRLYNAAENDRPEESSRGERAWVNIIKAQRGLHPRKGRHPSIRRPSRVLNWRDHGTCRRGDRRNKKHNAPISCLPDDRSHGPASLKHGLVCLLTDGGLCGDAGLFAI